MTKKTLIEWSESTVAPNYDLRSKYSYDTVINDHGGDWLAFHDAWAGIYEYTLYDSLIDLGEPYNKIVYQIHPYEFLKFEDVITEAKNKTILYVDLDLNKYGSWLKNATDTLKFTDDRPTGSDYSNGLLLRDKYNAISISLTNILDSTDKFESEYERICQVLDIIPEKKLAVELYMNWRKHRVDYK